MLTKMLATTHCRLGFVFMNSNIDYSNAGDNYDFYSSSFYFNIFDVNYYCLEMFNNKSKPSS